MQTSGAMRRENAKVCLSSIVGWVERSETHRSRTGTDGYRFAPPILRDCMKRKDGPPNGRLEGQGHRPHRGIPGYWNPTPSRRNRPACLDFRQWDFPLVT